MLCYDVEVDYLKLYQETGKGQIVRKENKVRKVAIVASARIVLTL